jgi:hypothetical protein
MYERQPPELLHTSLRHEIPKMSALIAHVLKLKRTQLQWN